MAFWIQAWHWDPVNDLSCIVRIHGNTDIGYYFIVLGFTLLNMDGRDYDINIAEADKSKANIILKV